MPGLQLYTGCVCSWECYVGEHDDPEHTCDPDPDTTCDRDVRSSLLQWRPRRHKHAMCVAPSVVDVHQQAPCVNLLAASSCTGQGRTHVCDGACRCSGESAVEEATAEAARSELFSFAAARAVGLPDATLQQLLTCTSTIQRMRAVERALAECTAHLTTRSSLRAALDPQ